MRLKLEKHLDQAHVFHCNKQIEIKTYNTIFSKKIFENNIRTRGSRW